MLIIELSLLLLLLISLLSIVALLISRTAGSESSPSISSPTRSRKMLPSREDAPTNCDNHVGTTSILGGSASAGAVSPLSANYTNIQRQQSLVPIVPASS